MILRAHNLTKRFGGTVALASVNVEFRPGELASLVGSNGAGKSTLFNVITGLTSTDSGHVTLTDGISTTITGMRPHIVAAHGVGLLFQDVRLFASLSVLENVIAAVPEQFGERPLHAVIFRKRMWQSEARASETAMQALDEVGVAHLSHTNANELSYGEQKLVAIARLLAGGSKVLLLDEPTSGIHPERVIDMLKLVRRLAEDHKKTVVMIEHNLDAVSAVSDRVHWLEHGQLIRSGTFSEVFNENNRSMLPSRRCSP